MLWRDDYDRLLPLRRSFYADQLHRIALSWDVLQKHRPIKHLGDHVSSPDFRGRAERERIEPTLDFHGLDIRQQVVLPFRPDVEFDEALVGRLRRVPKLSELPGNVAVQHHTECGVDFATQRVSVQ